MKKSYIIGVVILIFTAGAILALNRNSDQSSTSPPPENTTIEDVANPGDQQQSNESATSQATLTYTNEGFNPETLTVSAGATISIRNQSSKQLDFASDDHPAHRDNSELNIGDIAPGENKTMSLSEKGTWGYHNHVHENDSGRITVR